jgi:hypothetical protein
MTDAQERITGAIGLLMVLFMVFSPLITIWPLVLTVAVVMLFRVRV